MNGESTFVGSADGGDHPANRALRQVRRVTLQPMFKAGHAPEPASPIRLAGAVRPKPVLRVRVPRPPGQPEPRDRRLYLKRLREAHQAMWNATGGDVLLSGPPKAA